MNISSLLDLTNLNEQADAAAINTLCEKALAEKVAAVCVYPFFVTQVKEKLKNSSIKVATVANFPKGVDSIEAVIASIQQSIQQGADEIDVVFPHQDYLNGNQEAACDFVRACKQTCGESILLKVILETGALNDLHTIAEVSYGACHAGADFLKTSTGKIAQGARLEAVSVMLEIIKKTPRSIGCKVSGGVRTMEQALQYVKLASDMMGEAWITPAHFRIGTSRLI